MTYKLIELIHLHCVSDLFTGNDGFSTGRAIVCEWCTATGLDLRAEVELNAARMPPS